MPTGSSGHREQDSGSLWGPLAVRLRAWLSERLHRREHELAKALIATLPFGAACWTAEARLIAVNPRFAERIGPEAALLTPGADYGTVLYRLATGGSLHPVREDEENRLV